MANEELRLAMAKAGHTTESLAHAVGVDVKTVSRWIRPGRVPHPRFQKAAAEQLDSTIAELWPDRVRRRFETWLRPWIEVEREATSLRTYQPQVVPGLLQTEPYAVALLMDAGLLPRTEAGRRAKARIERQTVLRRAEPPLLTAVMDIGVLRRPVGGAGVMPEQLDQLIEVAAQCQHVRLHVVPEGVGAYAGVNGAFVLATAPGGQVTGYLDTQLSGRTLDDREEIAALVAAWESCRGEALPHRQSLDLIRELRDGHHRREVSEEHPEQRQQR